MKILTSKMMDNISLSGKYAVTEKSGYKPKPTDILIYIGEQEELSFYEFSQFYEEENKVIWRKTLYIDDKIPCCIDYMIDDLFSVYYEIGSIEKAEAEYSRDKEYIFDKTAALLERVKKRGKIDDVQYDALYKIFIGIESKKSLLKDGKYTIDLINDAYHEATNEIPYCYPERDKAAEYYISLFNDGEIQFVWNMDLFAAYHNIEKGILRKILATVFSDDEIESFCNQDTLTAEEKSELKSRAEDKFHYIQKWRREFYMGVAKELIDNKTTHVKEISEYANENGYNFYAIVNCMKILGVTPNYHHFEGISLSDFFETEV